MMSKTHVFMGIASSLLISQPVDNRTLLLSVAGGALGGIVADIDTLKNDYKCDALIGQIIALGIVAICFMLDWYFKLGSCISFVEGSRFIHIVGVLIYLILVFIGLWSSHRTFTHSILAMSMFGAATYLIVPLMSVPYMIGFGSHLVLDILNKKPVKLLFPFGKGICLSLCYAGKTANTVFMYIGLVASIILIISYSVLNIF